MHRMNPMKVTAIVLIILGVLIAGYAVMCFAASAPGAANGSPNNATPAVDTPLMSNPWVLFPFDAIAFLGGVGMLLYGGRGAIHTRNPAVRR